VRLKEIVSRPGWGDLPAVREGHVHEINSDDILQPGFSLVNGYDQIKHHIQKV